MAEHPKVVVVSGIDTGIGKTVVTGLLARWFKDNAIEAITMKMAQTGCSSMSDDILEHRKLAGQELVEEDAMGITCPYVFPVPCSPHLAARLEGRSIDPEVIVRAAEQLVKEYSHVLMEGVGGLFVPLNESTLVIDLCAERNWPVLMVSSPRLGSINHTLAALEALDRRNISLVGLVYNLDGSRTTDPRIVDDSRRLFSERLSDIGFKGKICDVPDVSCTESYCVDFSVLFN